MFGVRTPYGPVHFTLAVLAAGIGLGGLTVAWIDAADGSVRLVAIAFPLLWLGLTAWWFHRLRTDPEQRRG